MCWFGIGLDLGGTPARAAPPDQDARFVGAAEPGTPAEEYGLAVRSTQWQSPERELAGFHVPPGFEVELVASEPEIAKPLNMAWDSRGRLWITTTVEYPYPAGADRPGRDAIKVCSDRDGDGRYDTVTTFAEGMNIPIGVIPVEDGAICFSIPYLWRLEDTDGDGVADRRHKLLGPFDTTRDTHGMINALRRGHDGWIYACHGFNNQSQVVARDGSQATLISGNTFCFSEDGAHIERFTRGQVNPFGMTEDQFGNWYTADCHSRPLTALIRGACYPSFGRPHDGLGFAPEMMSHFHRSTAISGVALVDDRIFPEAYRGVFYSGNVMTSRINANRLVRRGATVTAAELPDFMTSDDPWFRPVDVRIGPDGALYVADFYNRIIGHYEVPLDHPGRDRTSGRIWRIVARKHSDADRGQRAEMVRRLARCSEMSLPELRQWMVETLDSENMTLRRSVIERLVPQPQPARDVLSAWCADTGAPAMFRAGCLEILARRGQLSAEQVVVTATALNDARSLSQLMRMAGRWPERLAGPVVERARRTIGRVGEAAMERAEVAKAAVELLGRRGEAGDVELLWRLALRARADDPMLAHAARTACALVLRRTGNIDQFIAARALDSRRPQTSVEQDLERILAGVDRPAADRALLRRLVGRPATDLELADLVLQRVSASADGADAEMIVRLLDRWRDKPDLLVQRVERIWPHVQSRPAAVDALSDSVKEWVGQRLILPLQEVSSNPRAGSGLWLDGTGLDWPRQLRRSSDGRTVELMSSHRRGESYRGILLSPVFSCPTRLSFLVAGHNGPPGAADERRNQVRLVLVPDGVPIASAYPPREDLAHRVAWELEAFEGRQVRFEVDDAHGGNAYAWIAVGGFSVGQLDSAPWTADFSRGLQLLNLGLGQHLDSRWWNQLEQLPWPNSARYWLAIARRRAHRDPLAADLIQIAWANHRVDWLERWVHPGFNPAGTLSHENMQTEAAGDLIDRLDRTGRHALLDRLVHRTSGLVMIEHMIAQNRLSPPEVLPHLGDAAGQLPAGLQALVDHAKEQPGSEALDADQRAARLSQRLASLDWAEADRDLGRRLFERHCALCHRLRGLGNEIAPQLDGVAGRGVKRLAEDILLPNANVDPAFRVKVLRLAEDEIVSGIVQSTEEGWMRVVASDGSVRMVDASKIVAEKQTERSLMPENLGTLLNDRELASLLWFIGEQNPDR